MNDVDPTGTASDADSVELPPPGKQPRRRPTTALLTAAPSLALTALVAGPLTAAVRIAAHFGDPQTVAVVADKCDIAFAASALHTLKWPGCAGD